MARDAIEGCMVVGPGVGPGGEVRGRIVLEPHRIAVHNEGDANNGVGVIAVDEVLDLGELESKMAQGLKHLPGRGELGGYVWVRQMGAGRL